jgi:hypothetical protein
MKQAAATCARARRFENCGPVRGIAGPGRSRVQYSFLALANELLADRRYTAAVALFRRPSPWLRTIPAIELGLAKAYHFLREPQLAARL